MFLAYASPKGRALIDRALIDRELYLPRSWTGDEGRLAGARVPGKTAESFQAGKIATTPGY